MYNVINEKRFLILRYIIFDMFAAFVVWIIFMYFRQIVNDGKLFENVQVFIPKYNFFSSLLVYPFFCLFIHSLSGIYIRPLKHTRIQVFTTTLASSIVISITIFFCLLLDDIVVSYEYYYYSLIVLFLLQFVVTLIVRFIMYSDNRYNFKTKKWTINTVVIGVGSNAQKIAQELEKHAEQNNLIGFVSLKHINSDNNSLANLGNLSQIESIIGKYKIEEAIIALDDTDEKELFSIINSLYAFNIRIRFTPRLYEILTGSAKIDEPHISPLVDITTPSMPDWQISIKRFVDIVASILALVVLSPIIVYFMFYIKYDSKGSVFYTQERIGQYGRPFNIIKFRTMIQNAEGNGPNLSSATDKRVTKVGRILRKYRLDEIPQFWNILRGDMSLVGPRPERKFYIDKIIEIAPYYCLIYKIRPGLTSWGPIRIGYTDTLEKMIERLNYDIIYIDNMSLLADLKILIYTFEIIFKGKGM